MIKFRRTTYTNEAVCREFEIDEATLKEWDLTPQQFKDFLADPENAPDEVFDLAYEMIGELDYDIYDEDTHDDGDQWFDCDGEE